MNTEPFIQLRRELHQIPELGFAEYKTQQHILSYLQTIRSNRMEIKTWRTGLMVKLRGKNPTRCIGYRTDIDGLPIEEDTTYTFHSKHKGRMHACGHDLHMSIALGILTHFAQHPIDNDLLFIFEPAEEGPGGALPMIDSEIFQAWKPDMIIALHIAPEYPVGTIATRPGILFANTSECMIDLHGTSGHAAFPHQANDMVLATSQLISQLHTIVSRNINPLESAILTLGKLAVGTKENIIAGSARIEGTIRTLSMETMHIMKGRIEEVTYGIAHSFACQANIDWGTNYCQVDNDEVLTREFMNWLALAEYQLIECQAAMTGEDFGYFLQEIPGFMFWLGVDSSFGLHHPKLEPKEEAIPVGIDVMTRYIRYLSEK